MSLIQFEGGEILQVLVKFLCSERCEIKVTKSINYFKEFKRIRI